MTPTNESRAERARRALVAYKGAESGSVDSPEAIIDMLTDLHHMVQERYQTGVSDLLSDWVHVARLHFEIERKK